MKNQTVIIFALGILIFFFGAEMFPADDGFFYLQIASNFIKTKHFYFHKFTETNGFHPLWQFISVIIAFFSNGNKLIQLFLSIVFQLLLFYSAVTLLRKKVQLYAGFIVLSTIFLSLGTLFLTESFLTLSLLCFWISLYQDKSDIRYNLISSVTLGFLVLSRLDLIIFPIIYFSYELLNFKWKKISQQIPFFLITLLPYLIWNFVNFHTFSTVSAQIKSHFPHLIFNLPDIWGNTLIIANTILFSFIFVYKKYETYNVNIFKIMYLTQLVKWLFYFCFNDSTAQWYYTLEYLLSALLINVLYELYEPKLSIIPKSILTISIPLIVLFIKVYQYKEENKFAFQHPVIKFVENLKKEIKKEESVFVYDSPGRIAFFTECNVIPTDGLVSSKEFYKKIRQTSFTDFCIQNKVKYIIAPYSANNDFSYNRLSVKVKNVKNNINLTIFNPFDKTEIAKLNFINNNLLIFPSPLSIWQKSYNNIAIYPVK